MTIVVGTTVVGCLGAVFFTMPMMIIFTRVSPFKIEASSFALMAGFNNFFLGVVSFATGSYLADALGVTSDDLSGYYVLVEIALVTTTIGLCYVWVVPTNAAFDLHTEKIKKDHQNDE